MPGPRRRPLPRPAPPRRRRPRRPGPAAAPAARHHRRRPGRRHPAGRRHHQLPHPAAPRPAAPAGPSPGAPRSTSGPSPCTAPATVTDLAVASYLAKYSTKGTEATGHASARITAETIDLYANPDGTHPERLIDACWSLGAHPGYVSLRRWAHMLGFGGHFLTKARRYSVTFRDLRQARITYRRRQDTGPDHGPIRTADHTDEETILIVGTSPTPEPAGKPAETPYSPTPPPTRPANAAKPDATSSPTNRRDHRQGGRVKPSRNFLTIKRQNQTT